jgi:hypothetical protein
MKKILFITGCLSLLFFTACKKELSDNFNTYTGHPLNDTTWTRNVGGSAAVHQLIDLLAPGIVIDSFEVSRDTTLKYGDSLEISFKGGSCIGIPAVAVTGQVKLEFLWLKKKGDYIKTFRPTISNGSLLETAGAFYIRVSKEGNELVLAQGTTVKIRFSDSTEPKNNMQVFYGQENNPIPIKQIDTAFNWIRDTDTTWLKTFQKQNTSGSGAVIKGYELTSKNLRWVAAERYINSISSKTRITTILPLNFTNKNTAVFAVFANQNTVLNLRGDYPSRSFAAANIALGTRLKIVSISRIGSDLYLGTKEVSEAGSAAAYSLTPEKKSLKDIIGFLNSL